MPSARKKKNPWIVITPGDPAGIGFEVTTKALRSPRVRELYLKKGFKFVCVGARAPLSRYKLPKEIAFLSSPEGSAGFQAGWSIQLAATLVRKMNQSGTKTALVTGPVSKASVASAGFKFKGHTEFLEQLWCAEKRYASCSSTMMLANQKLRVALVTTHIPLRQVASRVTKASLEKTFSNTYSFLKETLLIKKPRIAVCGLNPHAGDSGLLGTEEISLLAPVLKQWKRHGFEGPFPSDTLFSMQMSRPKSKKWDAIIALYHDQGLAPIKLVDFANTINITLGLPYIRTSVDHGTAFDIAGKGIADPKSMIEAICSAAEFLTPTLQKS